MIEITKQEKGILFSSLFVLLLIISLSVVFGSTEERERVNFGEGSLVTQTELVNVPSANAFVQFEYSGEGKLSADGRYVAFASDAIDATGGHDGYRDVFLRDMVTGVTVLVSVGSDFNDLVLDDENGCRDVFVRDIVSSTKVKPFLTDKKFYEHHGFEVIDSAPPYFELLVLKFKVPNLNPRP